MTRLPKLSLAIALGSAAASPACFEGIDLCSPVRDLPLVPEVHGRYVSSTAPARAITWSPSGDEVTFVSADYRTAHAHHLPSGATRQLYASNTPGEQIVDAQLSADGVDWFTSSFNAGDSVIRYVVRRHTSAGSTVLTDRGRGVAYPAWVHSVLVASGQPVAAFIVWPDSLFLLRRGGEPTLLGSGCTGIVAFSPDESQALCSDGPLSFRVFRTDGGTAESLVLPPDVAGRWVQLIRWGAQGIQVLYWGSTHYRLYEHHSGSSRPITPVPKNPESTIGFGTVSWSSDGRKVAYWNSSCAQSGGCLSFSGDGCPKGQVLLYVLDVATGTATRVAVHTFGPSSGAFPVAVSPTGSMVAYTANGGLYLLEVK